MTSARSGHTATLLPSGMLLVVGGAGPNGPLANADLFDPTTGAWSGQALLIQSRRDHAATLLSSGKLLVTGGEGPDGLRELAELYDPVTQRRIIAGILHEPRKNHTMTVLSSGKVLITGGEGSNGALGSTEVYDPDQEILYPSNASLAQARASFTATLLPSGKVLVVGGAGSSGALTSAELYDPATHSWSSTGSLSQARKSHVAMLLPSGKVLVAGGSGSSGPLTSAELYDPATGSWSSTGSLAQARTDTTATLLTSGKVLVAGGSGTNAPLTSAELYDPATGAWTTTLALSLVRGNHTATLLPSGKVLVVGGLGTSGPLASAELYNPAAGSWTGTGPSSNRYCHAATLLPSGKVLVVGGFSNNIYLNSAELYDPATRTWTATGSLSLSRCGHSATLLPSGKVLVVGGAHQNNDYLASAELYDPATGTWTATGSLAQSRSSHTATLLPSGKVLVAGGYDGSALNGAELYDPDTGSWSETAPLSLVRSGHTATLLSSGKVLVVGTYDRCELYDPATGTWSATGSLSLPRDGHSATLLPSGKVLVAGGAAYNSYLTQVEVYDPATGSWTQGASLHRAHYSHAATLLPSGKVLVAGGFDGTSAVNSELYDPATGSWTVNASLPQGPYEHTATLLPSGQVLVMGGSSFIPVVYDDTGAQLTWRPDIVSVSASAPLTPGSVFTVNGSLFRGLSEASGGGSRSSPTNFPLLTLRDVERGWQRALPSQDFSSTHVTASVPQVPPGHYLLSVTVNGLTASTVLAIAPLPDTTPPTVTLTSPAAGATLIGTVTLAATAVDDRSVNRVEFYDGATLMGTDTAPPYSLSWDTRSTANGPRVLTVKAFDSVGQSATSPGVSVTVDNEWIPPTVAITSPVEGATVTGSLTVTATATDNRIVARVELYDGASLLCSDTSAPYSCNWYTRMVPNGEHVLTAKAYDGEGNMGVATVTVTVDNDLTPPTAELIAPTEGATLTGLVTFTATASDASGISKVDFFVNNALLGTATSAPYSITYNTWLQYNGPKTLMVQAYDAFNNLTNSASVNVTFANDQTPPTVALTSPAEGATLTGTVTFTATADDASGIAKVVFSAGDTEVGTVTSAPYSVSYNTRSLRNGPLNLYARAYDTLGNLKYSGPVSATVDNDFTPPTVTLTAPKMGAILLRTVTLSVTASDNVGITQVEYYDGATLLGTATSAPFSFAWDTRTTANGTHVLYAKAYDAAQATYSTGVSVTVDNDEVAPTVAFTAPAAGTLVTGTLSLAATASDNVAVTRVEFYDGDTRLSTDTLSPYSYSWSTLTSPNGAHTLTAKAFDAKGNIGTAEVTVTVDNDHTPPTVALTAPAEGETVSGTVVLSAMASDNKAVARVAFFVGSTQVGTDTSAPYSYSYNTRLLSNGAKVLTAKAYDAANNVGTSTTVNVTFDNDFTPPTVTLTAPAEGETLTGTVTFTATAGDASGISKVAFFVGTTQVGTDTSAPYSYSYNTRLLSNGAKVLTAKAYDAFNTVATSTAVNVTFDNDFTPPTVTLTAPAEGEALSGTVTFSATASDASGISKVVFFVGTTQVGTDTAEPYSVSYNTRSLTNGAKVLTAKAYDAFNTVATSTAVNVTFDNDFTVPVTSISSPTGGSTVSGVVQIDAVASDDRGPVTQVDFYRGSTLMGTVTSAPFTWTWDTTKATVGGTTLKTRAWDAAGNSAYSPNVTVTVTRQAAASEWN